MTVLFEAAILIMEVSLGAAVNVRPLNIRKQKGSIAVVNELRAKGSFTQTVLGVTIIMDVVVIVLFAANSSVADALFSGLNFKFGFILLLVLEIGASIVLGYLVFLLLRVVLRLGLQKFIKAVFILTTG